MKAEVDEELCVGCELCVETCPEVFEMEGDISRVIVDEIPDDAEECAWQAERECPVEAIAISEPELRLPSEIRRVATETRVPKEKKPAGLDERLGGHTFICYSHEDRDFVSRLASNIRQEGIRLWLDDDIPGGAHWNREIDNAIRDCASFLIVLSPAAVDSDEVQGELRMAFDEKKDVVPVLYQKCNIPRRLREIQFIDFSSHDPDDEIGLRKVLRVLRALGA